ncbi:hypothetical protein [Collimonas arenae]|uniref:hypothetical protein n=1 Tax=Collimonas arenae TaxID=279058 RepID=UPI00056F1B51|nr:hypothetical protein [Collimonas arenae]
MKDFVRVDIKSKLEKTDVLEIFSRVLQDFRCRTGESDAQGGYVVATNSDGVQIQCWTGETPMEFSISFRSAKLDSGTKEKLVKRIFHDLLPLIGEIVTLDA